MARTILFASIALCCSALDAAAGCKELAAAVENALKEAAAIEARGAEERGQTSASVQQRVTNQLAAINANLALMDRAKCPAPQDPVSVGELNPYNAAAKECARTAMGDCNRDAWKRTRP
jgi:hypothetical protein